MNPQLSCSARENIFLKKLYNNLIEKIEKANILIYLRVSEFPIGYNKII